MKLLIIIFISFSIECNRLKKYLLCMCCCKWGEEVSDNNQENEYRLETISEGVQSPVTKFVKFEDIKESLKGITLYILETGSQELKYVIMETIYDIIQLFIGNSKLLQQLNYDIYLFRFRVYDYDLEIGRSSYYQQSNENLKDYLSIVIRKIEDFQFGSLIEIKDFLSFEMKGKLADHNISIYDTYNLAFFNMFYEKLCNFKQKDIHDQIYEEFVFWCLTLLKIGSSFYFNECRAEIVRCHVK